MKWLIEATWDGSVFGPEEPVAIPPNTRVLLSVEIERPKPESKPESASFFEVALSLSIDGPPDWSARVDHYLYGPMIGDDQESDPSDS